MEREREVLVVGESDYLDRFYSFQRTFSKAPTADTASPLYFDSHPASLAALHAQLRANRTYSVPWNATEGFNPSVDKSHAAYLKTFCDDSARILAETVLRQYAAREESMDALELEVADHARVARGLAETFVGRIGVLEEMERVLRGDSTHALVIYGPAGIGKSALLAKLIHDVRDPENPLHHAVFVSRFVGATRDASNLHSLVSSVCEQIARMYGVDNMRARITEEIESLGEAADPASAGLSEELFGLLEFWPPMSPAGLKTGLWVAMGLASPEKPLVLVCTCAGCLAGLEPAVTHTDYRWPLRPYLRNRCSQLGLASRRLAPLCKTYILSTTRIQKAITLPLTLFQIPRRKRNHASRPKRHYGSLPRIRAPHCGRNAVPDRRASRAGRAQPQRGAELPSREQGQSHGCSPIRCHGVESSCEAVVERL
ncbi:hypothetical protein BC830DRAFT_204068 [Chytriomyces sp. MP71]|nr:hypothetical protein BC830DRAFT_204068 [Chytriomyces sp. MP71]